MVVSFEPTWEVFYVRLRKVFLVLKTAIAELFVFPRRLKSGRVFWPGAVDPFTPVPQTFHGLVLNNSGVEGHNRRCCSVHVTVAPVNRTLPVCLTGFHFSVGCYTWGKHRFVHFECVKTLSRQHLKPFQPPQPLFKQPSCRLLVQFGTSTSDLDC